MDFAKFVNDLTGPQLNELYAAVMIELDTRARAWSTVAPEVDAHEKALVRQRQFVLAVKCYKDRVKCNLQEALAVMRGVKDRVEAEEWNHRNNEVKTHDSTSKA